MEDLEAPEGTAKLNNTIVEAVKTIGEFTFVIQQHSKTSSRPPLSEKMLI